MSAKRLTSKFPPERRTSARKPGGGQRASVRPRPINDEEEILALVRTGVEKFILKNATIEDFFRTMHAVADHEQVYSHQLTKAVFSRIVKNAIRQRTRMQSK